MSFPPGESPGYDLRAAAIVLGELGGILLLLPGTLLTLASAFPTCSQSPCGPFLASASVSAAAAIAGLFVVVLVTVSSRTVVADVSWGALGVLIAWLPIAVAAAVPTALASGMFFVFVPGSALAFAGGVCALGAARRRAESPAYATPLG